MLTDDLMDSLASDLRPVRPRSLVREVALLGALCAAEMAAFLMLGFMRPDMPHAVTEPSFWWKLVSLGLIGGYGLAVALTSLNPSSSPRKGLGRIATLVAVCLAAGWLVDSLQKGMPTLLERLDVASGVACMEQIVVLSLPPVIALGYLMRRGAPTEPRRTALVAGLAAAAWGAFVFVFSCPYDDPLYVAVWYSAACALVTVVARLVLPPLTRW